MSDKTRPTIDPTPEDGSADFTATVTAPPGAWERLTENLDRINRGFAERDQQQ
jgi:hypothetical protein